MNAVFNTEPVVTRFLTLKEVAALLYVSDLTVYRLIDRRALRAFRVARRLRFHPHDVRAFLDNGKTPGPHARA